MDEITFGHIHHEPFTYDNYYFPSFSEMLKYNKDRYRVDQIVKFSIEKNPAANYNEIIDECRSKYLLLTHTDVTFGRDFLERIERTIDAVPDFGALGMVGVNSEMQYKWGKAGEPFKVETLDCNSILINLEHGLRFDEKIFDEFHLYCEDYACQLKEKGLSCHTLMVNCNEMSPLLTFDKITEKENFFNHHSYTVSQRGYCWGRYGEFKKKLCDKWGYSVITT